MIIEIKNLILCRQWFEAYFGAWFWENTIIPVQEIIPIQGIDITMAESATVRFY